MDVVTAVIDVLPHGCDVSLGGLHDMEGHQFPLPIHVIDRQQGNLACCRSLFLLDNL
jgi:hypothetical protein